MTEHNEPSDRVSANNWYNAETCLRALDELKFSFAALAATCCTPGSHERELARLATDGFRHRVDYLHDSLRRALAETEKPT